MSHQEIISSEVHRRNAGNEARAAGLKVFHQLRYWPLLYFICLGLSFGTAFLYLRYKRPTYVISAKLVSKDTDGLSNIPLSRYKKAEPLQPDNLPVDDPETMKFRSAILAVVKDLNLTVRYQKKGRLVDLALYKNVPVKFQLVRMGTPGFKQFEVLIKNKNTFLLKKGKENAGEFAFNKIYTSEIGSWLITKTPSFDRYIGQTLIIQVQDPETATAGLLSDIQTVPLEDAQNTTLLSIKDKVPERGEAILSQLIRQLNLTLEQEEATQTAGDIKLIDQSLLAFNEKVDSLQMELSALSSAERDVQLSATAENYLKVAKRNGVALNKINFELAALSLLEDYVKRGEPDMVPPASASGLSNSTLSGLVRQLIVLQSQRQQLLKTHLQNDPVFSPLAQQAAGIREAMAQSVFRLKSEHLKKRAALESFDDLAGVVLNGVSPEERKLVILKQKQITYENQYAFLVKRKEEASLKRASSGSVSDTPEISYKADVNRNTTYTWALLCGLLVPSFIVAGRSMLYAKNHPKTP
jgi:uncharacterized protein involved in exopolysaccharide biosynthesis